MKITRKTKEREREREREIKEGQDEYKNVTIQGKHGRMSSLQLIIIMLDNLRCSRYLTSMILTKKNYPVAEIIVDNLDYLAGNLAQWLLRLRLSVNYMARLKDTHEKVNQTPVEVMNGNYSWKEESLPSSQYVWESHLSFCILLCVLTDRTRRIIGRNSQVNQRFAFEQIKRNSCMEETVIMRKEKHGG